MSNYLGSESWVRSSPQQEGEGLYAGLDGLGGAFDTGNAVVDRLMASANATLATLLRPSWAAIDQCPLPADQKTLLKNQPVTFYLQVFGPIENLAAEIVVEANRLSGKQTRLVGLPGLTQATVNMDPNNRDIEQIASPSGRHLVRLLRIAMQWMVLTYQDALHLGMAVARVFQKYGIQGGDMVRSYVLQAGGQAMVQAQRLATAGAAAVENVQQTATRAGQNAAAAVAAAGQQLLQTLAQAVPPLNLPPPPPLPVRLWGLGQGGPAETGTAVGAGVTGATGAGVATGVISTPMLAALIVAIITALLPVAGAAATAAIQQVSPPQPTPGSVRPGPDGSTDGYWLNGQWFPNDASGGPLGALTLPIGLGLGAIALLYVLKK